jgi:hypothetical protein
VRFPVEATIVVEPGTRGAPRVRAVRQDDGHAATERGVWRRRDLRAADAQQDFCVCLRGNEMVRLAGRKGDN